MLDDSAEVGEYERAEGPYIEVEVPPKMVCTLTSQRLVDVDNLLHDQVEKDVLEWRDVQPHVDQTTLNREGLSLALLHSG